MVMSLARVRFGKYFDTGSSIVSFPSSANRKTQAQVNCLVTDPMAKLVSAVIGGPSLCVRWPYPFAKVTLPSHMMATERPARFFSFTFFTTRASIFAGSSALGDTEGD